MSLERDPEMVVDDLQLNRISAQVATDILRVVWTRRLRRRRGSQKSLRDKNVRDRIARGTPYHEFVKQFVKPEPPKELLYYGSWPGQRRGADRYPLGKDGTRAGEGKAQ